MDDSPVRANLPSVVRRYGLAVVAIAIAAWLRAELAPLLGDRVPFLTLFFAVLAAAWYGGIGPGLVATALGILATTAFPALGWGGAPAEGLTALLRFGVGAVVATVLLHRVRRDAGELRGERARRSAELADINRELQHRVEELQTLFEAAPVAIWVAHDPECRRVSGNHLARTLFHPGSESAPETAPIDLDRYRVESAGRELGREDLPLRRVIRTGAPDRDREIEVIAKDGSRRVFTVNATPLQDEAGHTRGAMAIALEVTERRRAEAARTQLAGIVDSSDDAIIGKTLEGIVTSWNRGAERLYGYTAAEAIGRSIALVIPPERAGELPSILARLARGERVEHYETVRVHKDGSRIEISATVSPITDEAGRTLGASVIARDVRQQRRTEVTLRFLAEASESLAALVDYRSTLQNVARLAVPDFADWCAVDMLAADGAVERLAVAHVDPSKVRLAEELYRRYPPDPDAPYGVPNVLRTGSSERVAEITDAMIEESLPDQERRSLMHQLGLRSYMCVPLRVKDRTLGAISFVAAESGRRYDARDLAAAEDLARRAAIAIDNARLYQELREADRRKDEFLAILSHELRNPLAPIRTGIEMLAMDSAGGDDQVVKIMRQQVEHLVRLVDDLLDISRITRGRVELRKQPVDLADVLERAAAAMRSSLDARRQTLEVSNPKTPVPLDADPVRLLQILENLLQNASKFSDEGARIELAGECANGEAVIRVRDPGIGIEPALLPRLFEPFTQSSHSLDRAQGGLGIGLALVRGLVERHGGTITASSPGRGRGSEFVVRLPLGEEAPPAAAAGRDGAALEGRRILVVDDNTAAARMLALLLGRLGDHDVETAHDGPSAVAKVRARHPEIVLLDLGLPRMDGYEVGRAIRRDREFDDVLLVALTGYGQEEDRRRTRDAGFDEHLVKPPALEEIERLFHHPKLTASTPMAPRTALAHGAEDGAPYSDDLLRPRGPGAS